MTKIDLDELERVATAALDADFGFFTGDLVAAKHFVATSPRETLALVARIRDLDDALNDALAYTTPGDERDRLVAVLVKGAVLP